MKINIKMNKKQRLLTEKIIAYVLVSVCSIFFIVPLLWMLLTALKSTEDLANGVFFPTKAIWENFATAVNAIPFAQYTFNSIYYAFFATIGYFYNINIICFCKIKMAWKR